MSILDANFGSARDNMSCPVHNWYKFTAGFSYKFVDIILKDYVGRDVVVYDPFAGCGTTLVECQKNGFRSIGNESQELMCDIIRAKLNWDISYQHFNQGLDSITRYLKEKINSEDIVLEFHPLLRTLYDEPSLRELYCIRNAIRLLKNNDAQLFFNLALSQTLHKAALHPISGPYIVRSSYLIDSGKAWEKFQSISSKMFDEIHMMPHRNQLSTVYNWDSRKMNKAINDGSCGLCITSPPYLNNLDYGEVNKVHSHFFEMTSDWNDITQKVRRKLVTGATTHYRDADFLMEEYVKSEFAQRNPYTLSSLLDYFERIRLNSYQRKGKKSYHILMMHYFEDMYYVLKEMRRVLTDSSEAYLILGDSAPYGIYVPTTQILGEISQSVGFKDFSIYKIRSRGNKWKGLTKRHSIALSENLLILHT